MEFFHYSPICVAASASEWTSHHSQHSRGSSIAGRIAGGLCLLSSVPHSASCSSVVLTPPSGWNGFALSAQIETGFRASDGGGIISTKASTFMLVLPGRDGVPGLLIESNPLSVTQIPTSGAAKDVATGEFKFSFTVGQADVSASDRFDFSLTSTTSASEALVNF